MNTKYPYHHTTIMVTGLLCVIDGCIMIVSFGRLSPGYSCKFVGWYTGKVFAHQSKVQRTQE